MIDCVRFAWEAVCSSGGSGASGDTSSLADADALALARGCSPSWTHHDARLALEGAPDAQLPALSKGWELKEDRPGKPAWVAGGAAGSTLVFRARFSSKLIVLAYLRSYQGLGSVSLSLAPASAPGAPLAIGPPLAGAVTLEGLYAEGSIPAKKRVSQLEVVTLRVGEVWPEVLARSEADDYMLTLTVQPGPDTKFCVVQMQSC